MSVIALILLVALLIPIMGIVVPIGRALARRLEGPQEVPPALTELAKKVELLEAEVDDLMRSVQALQDENQFLQRLLEDPPQRVTLPPPQSP
jgi:peptidoglycan hydrolase CwlO-like protein